MYSPPEMIWQTVHDRRRGLNAEGIAQQGQLQGTKDVSYR